MKYSDTKNNQAIIKSLSKINGTKWVGNTTFKNITDCLVAINLQTTNSGWYNPTSSRLPKVKGIFLINENGTIFPEARIIKNKDSYLIEYLSLAGWNEFEDLYCEFIEE